MNHLYLLNIINFTAYLKHHRYKLTTYLENSLKGIWDAEVGGSNPLAPILLNFMTYIIHELQLREF